jgi:hypothetical protein
MRKQTASSYMKGNFTAKKIRDYAVELDKEIKSDKLKLKSIKNEIIKMRITIKDYTSVDVQNEFNRFLTEKIYYKEGYYRGTIKTLIEKFIDNYKIYQSKVETLKQLIRLYKNFTIFQYNVIFNEFCFHYFNALIDTKKKIPFPHFGSFQIKKVDCSNIRYIDKHKTRDNLKREMAIREKNNSKELIKPHKFVVFQKPIPYRLYLKWSRSKEHFYRSISLMGFTPRILTMMHLKKLSYEMPLDSIIQYEDITKHKNV